MITKQKNACKKVEKDFQIYKSPKELVWLKCAINRFSKNARMQKTRQLIWSTTAWMNTPWSTSTRFSWILIGWRGPVCFDPISKNFIWGGSFLIIHFWEQISVKALTVALSLFQTAKDLHLGIVTDAKTLYKTLEQGKNIDWLISWILWMS